jgi:XTP/dITP diphosphohydrolase
MAVGIEQGTQILNRIITEPDGYIPPFATGNIDKINEIAAILGTTPDQLLVLNPKIDEIQSRNPDDVIKAKAKAAFEATGGIPVIVEDTSLKIPVVESKFPPTMVKYWAEQTTDRAEIAEEVNRKKDPRALAQTKLAVFDGKNVQVRTGTTPGTIPEKLTGFFGFGFDDMFMPEGSKKTFAEMTLDEKNEYSMRKKALEKMMEDPFAVGTYVFALNEAIQMELDAINEEFFKGPEMAQARKHAFNLKVLGNIQPNEELEVHKEDLPPFYEVKLHPDITQYTHDPKSNDLGLLITSYDMRELYDGTPTRLLRNPDGRPTFLQHGEKSLKRALAARAYEFSLHHNPKRYESLRQMLAGKKTEPRANIRSEVLDKMLGIIPNLGEILSEDEVASGDIFEVPGFTGLAYTREYSPNSLSRNKGANDHIINRNGIPTSVFALGGMPPVTGSENVIRTAALSFMRSYIPHNSLFVDFDRRLGLFRESKAQIENIIDDPENEDIKKLALAQIGICLSGKNIQDIQKETNLLIDEGCSSVRIYTTNPGREVTDSAEEICKIAAKRQKKGELPFHLCVGPIADTHQAKILQKTAQEYGVALTLLAGHGGGENCTSLEGGAAANAIEIMYQMSLDKDFNDVSLGFEGGLGSWYGPWMGIIDQVSKDGSIVRGTVESQGGLCVLHKTKKAVQIYHGTAGPGTQMPENTLYPHLAKRTNPAGQLYNNEGRPNYMEASRWAQSITHHFVWFRSLLGRTLADQQSQSIDDIMKKTKEVGFKGHRHASDAAVATAKSHRSV